ncbi:plasmid partitioning protein RepA [Sulfitobacter sp. HI0082]|uniref:plasmid partitioning protein RepA n=2 Tax=Pseudomonadota TaxID=1224 RepID=UPI0007C210F0|nr:MULTISPECIES: plasmid partitioning protein RepA [unclassified Sulfitobacter]KZZ24504.1 plasmid partitioning protein RepA [Sulfitobacter sp. HI0082]KZX93068.1 plasmid partitioning protein RepA [Sulfitobacter sp. HI0021]KZX96771.1 plasmid partitioning protein RepA [Sulfitobacter sp. HI0027]WPZ31410.1 plasmid partitioning protein RepA [Sulfitobacter sp. OXR-159]HAC47848.1 plasmid partitioning protein RepA [Sulfitobacter sp.]
MTDTVHINTRIRRNAETLSEALESHMLKVFAPDARKELRRFSAGEAAELLGISTSFLRKLHFDNKVVDVQTSPGGRRHYSAEDLLSIRRTLESTAKSRGAYQRGRRDGDKLQVLSFLNFKGGSGKTTSAIHAAQRLALKGYRVLCVDIDPQASLTTLFGYRPEYDFLNSGTIYDAIQYDDPVPLADVIQKTFFTGIDLAPGGLMLQEFEHETPQALLNNTQPAFFARLATSLQDVEQNYDVVIFDCPPQLGYLTMSALCASTGVLITVVPNMLDVASMSQFLQMSADLLDVVSNAGASMEFDFLRFLINRYEPNDGPQQQVLSFLRQLFDEEVMVAPMLKSTAISDAGLTHQTIYEVDRSQFHRSTYDRAVDSLNLVNDEIESMIQKAWGR